MLSYQEIQDLNPAELTLGDCQKLHETQKCSILVSNGVAVKIILPHAPTEPENRFMDLARKTIARVYGV